MPCDSASAIFKSMPIRCFSSANEENIISVEFHSDASLHEENMLNDPFSAEVLFRKDGKEYAGLLYKHQLGLLQLVAFLLVETSKCAFGYETDHDIFTDVSIQELWDQGLLRKP